ncbi:MAG: S-adenosyl-L-methionine-dependent methyltransferase [Monoraphidium minutum]|nr:MAG: S-adenosyl-L-methionine-dependent methyltransferase [Monoraphidium minutum]
MADLGGPKGAGAALPRPQGLPWSKLGGGAGPLPLTRGVAARNVTFGGHTLLLLAPTNDEHVGPPILETGQPFQPDILGFMMDAIAPGSVVVDAGCNIASYAVFFAARAGPDGSVHCFEPQRKMAHLASANAAVNGLSGRLAVHNAALSFAQGLAHMSATVPDGRAKGLDIKQQDSMGRVVNFGGMNLGRDGEAVPAWALDGLRLENVSFIKVDVQGAEKLVLYGAQDTIRRCMPVVAYEDQPAFTITQDMIEALSVPREVLGWDPAAYFQSLGYTKTQPAWGEVLMIPPGWRRPPGAAGPAAA